jgi:serine/threonine protein phosphatase 1
MGNHEHLFVNFLKGRDRALYFLNGGLSTLISYQGDRLEWTNDLVPSEHVTFYENLLTFVELDDYYVVHAGFRPEVDILNQSLEDMLWIREDFIYSSYDFGKRVIFGHTPFQEPLIMENKIGLDTGAVYRNRLTCLELPELRFHHVEA